MKECKEKATLPCYRDDTHDKVYELNKQMCDIGKTILTKKKNDMTEKKTNPMTKAEAFEWLKCKKIDCRNASSSQVQAKLFEIDMCWITGDKNICVTQFLLIDADGCISHCGDDEEYFDKLLYTKVSADDILSIEIVEEGKKSEEEEALDKISCLGAQIVDILLRMKGHHHVTITETSVALYDEGMCLFHSDPF